VKSDSQNRFLAFEPIQGLDGQKVAVLADRGAQLREDLAKKPNDPALQALSRWYATVEAPHADTDQPAVTAAVVHGGRRALQVTSAIPVAMAACFLLLVIYFAATGGYKAIHLDSSGREIEVGHEQTPPETMTGGVPAPVK
jgi:hypothetical protein